jgi:hypothetical protein
VKFRTTPAFEADFKKLKREHQKTFREVAVEKFTPACDQWADAGGSPTFEWPKSLRISMLVGTRGIYEMTWSFAAPAGRATFELVREAQTWVCLWRRVGDHDVYRRP